MYLNLILGDYMIFVFTEIKRFRKIKKTLKKIIPLTIASTIFLSGSYAYLKYYSSVSKQFNFKFKKG